MLKILEINQNLNYVILCLDNDNAGQTACEKFEKMLGEKDITCSKLIPKLKDFNEDLKEMNEISQLQPEMVMA